MSQDDFSQFSLADLFQKEAETQSAILTQGLLALERDPTAAAHLEELMRAAHSLKGAARIIGIDAAVHVSHAMEDCFVAAQKGKIVLGSDATDRLLQSTDLLKRIAHTPAEQIGVWDGKNRGEIEESIRSIDAITRGVKIEASSAPPVHSWEPESTPQQEARGTAAPKAKEEGEQDRILRVSAASLNRLLTLAGQTLVEARWLVPYGGSLLALKRQQWKLSQTLGQLRESLAGQELDETSAAYLAEAQQQAVSCLQDMAEKHAGLEHFIRRSVRHSRRLYDEALASRMRPFADGTNAFPRMVRDLGRSLCKDVRLEILGESTQVDRDVLDKLEAPLSHLLRNAVDHGIELPDERERLGKPREGNLRLEARHAAGLLLIIVEDDGSGIALNDLRKVIVRKKLTTVEVAEKLSEEELLDFLFLPGFSMRDQVTETSGRGVGLDVVRNMVKSVRGTVRVTSHPGRGVRFQLQLPLTLSVMRALLVEVAGEPYALPLVRIHNTIKVPRSAVEMLEGREHASFEKQRVGLVAASQLLGSSGFPTGEELSVVILGDHTKRVGLVVDKFLGERQLVVQPLDPRLRKIKDISAGALMRDGSPVLIIDLDDMVRSIEMLISGGHLKKLQKTESTQVQHHNKRVLVVDDSLTVRELERKLLSNAGYEVEVAVDGMDGWNAVHTQSYDLVVSDIDMPRMDGIELVRLIKKDPRLKSLPVMIVSYKDRQEDRLRGLEAGADGYLTKGSFHDETLIKSVSDLIGTAGE